MYTLIITKSCNGIAITDVGNTLASLYSLIFISQALRYNSFCNFCLFENSISAHYIKVTVNVHLANIWIKLILIMSILWCIKLSVLSTILLTLILLAGYLSSKVSNSVCRSLISIWPSPDHIQTTAPS